MRSILVLILRAIQCVLHNVLPWMRAHSNAIALCLIACLAFGLSAGVEYWQGRSERIPMLLLHFTAWLSLFGLPTALVWRHRRRQQQVITRVRGLFAVALEWLMQGREGEARRALLSIQRWEKHWRIGNSRLYRLAYSALIMGATTLVAVLYWVSHANIYSHGGYGQVPHPSIVDTLRYLLDHPIQIWLIGGLSLLFGLGAAEHLKDLVGAPWSEFYGDRLEAALRANRGIDEAPQHKGPDLPPDGVSAMELLGLNAGFTKQELRKAWLRLARELHPDRWSTSGEGVRLMKEAALKRVNAARDELATLAR